MNAYGMIQVAAATPKINVANTHHNTESIMALMDQAKAAHVAVLVFPELSITGYTCGDLFFQTVLQDAAKEGLGTLLEKSIDMDMMVCVGLPLVVGNSLYNCMVTLINGKLLGITPKTYLPNYQEFYEARWFRSSKTLSVTTLDLLGQTVPIGTDLIFAHDRFNAYKVGVEVCEDVWAPVPPSTDSALNGATLILNGSASNEVIGKHAYREQIISTQSAKTISGYVYATCGYGESTTDTVFAGQNLIYENGHLLAESQRFVIENQLIVSEIDCDHLMHDRILMNTYGDSCASKPARVIPFSQTLAKGQLTRYVEPHPFVPKKAATRYARCEEIFAIQTQGLATRLAHIGTPKAIIGISGGLDSTLALLVTVRAFELLGRDVTDIVGVTMPGFGTTDRTYQNAMDLMKHLGIKIREISIVPAVLQHFKDIGHDEKVHDLTYENSQARERTQILMDLCSQEGGIVIGTGDLSELALGFATYNGDHMSMYGVNASIPKTLVRHLVAWVAHHHTKKDVTALLEGILDTPVSPELLPPAGDGTISQITEEMVGPYELHDFFLYHMLRFGTMPEKIFMLAQEAFKGHYSKETLLKWMKLFYSRFFSQQFKRSCMPDGPKVGSINLSPRGDLRMPSDASMRMFMDRIETIKL